MQGLTSRMSLRHRCLKHEDFPERVRVMQGDVQGISCAMVMQMPERSGNGLVCDMGIALSPS